MHVNGLREIANRFDGMLIDQFGVLHDGRRPYPFAIETLQRLRDEKVQVAVISNSGKRTDANIRRLSGLGIARNLYADCVSSGELAYSKLPVGRAFIIGKRGENYGFDDVGISRSLQTADFILILGSNAPETSLDDYRRMLTGIKLPAICCNPDKWMLTAQGLQPAPGAIASLYQEMGGEVTWFGKPYPEIYKQACRLMGNPPRVLCIGDSAEHDIAGGKAVGLSTLLVMTGVSEGIGIESVDPKPDYWMDGLKW